MMAILAFLMFLGSSTIALGQEVAATLPAVGWMETLSMWLNIISQGALVVVILATVVVRIVPTKGNVTNLDTVIGKVMKVLACLPTFGINPRTKALEAALEDLRKQVPTPTDVEQPK